MPVTNAPMKMATKMVKQRCCRTGESKTEKRKLLLKQIE